MEWFAAAAFTDRLLTAVLALLLALALPGWRGFGAWMERRVRGAESKLNRQRRDTGTRVWRGIILMLFFLGLALIPACTLTWFSKQYPSFAYLEIVLLAALIPARALLVRVRAVGRALKRKDIAAAQAYAAALRSTNAQPPSDAHSAIRAAIEYLMENLAYSVIAPLFWFLLLGLPGAAAARMVQLLDDVLGHKSRRLLAFGWASAKLDDLLQYLPARITGVLLCLAACFVPRGRPAQAIRIIWRDAGRTASPNRGWPLSAAAGALHVTLAGPRRREDEIVKDSWIGSGSAQATRRDLSRAKLLYGVALLLWALMMVGALAALKGSH